MRLRAAKKYDEHWDSCTSIPAASPNSAVRISLQDEAWDSPGELLAQDVFWVPLTMNVKVFPLEVFVKKKLYLIF